MPSPFKVACLQNTATRDIAANIAWLKTHCEQAANAGAVLITTAETCTLIEPDNTRIANSTYQEADDPGLAMFRETAQKYAVPITIGSLMIKTDSGKDVNRAYYIDKSGEITARYDKLHMFDVQLKNGEYYKESDALRAGDKAVLVDTQWGKIGLSICYDLRFAALYRTLAQQGAKILTIPAAFTQTTGKAHWHILVRARAIETGSFVIATNQCGTHLGKRQSYGHSLIVDPWGEILADGGAQPGIIYADLDLDKVNQVRQMIPALSHDKDFSIVEKAAV